jgi:hypothetical protein
MTNCGTVDGSEQDAGTLRVPDPSTRGKFKGHLNIVLAGRGVADHLPHETGHVFDLWHHFNPFNLMCGPTSDEAIIDFFESFACNLGPSNSLQPWQVTDAKRGASKYEQ